LKLSAVVEGGGLMTCWMEAEVLPSRLLLPEKVAETVLVPGRKILVPVSTRTMTAFAAEPLEGTVTGE